LPKLGGLFADGIHVLFADVGRQHKLPGVLVAFLSHAHAEIHFGKLARDMPGHLAELCELLPIGREQLAQGIQILVNIGHGGVVGLQVTLIARQEVAPLSGLGIQHVLQQFVDGAAGLLGLFNGRCRIGRLAKTGFIDEDKECGGQHCQRQADGHFGYRKSFHGKLRLVLR
jgi:hypothetical protein